jgi:hypothetical protein
MTFNTTYGAVLSPFVVKYKEASHEKRRETVLKDAVVAVKQCWALLEEAEDLPQDLATVRVSLF